MGDEGPVERVALESRFQDLLAQHAAAREIAFPDRRWCEAAPVGERVLERCRNVPASAPATGTDKVRPALRMPARVRARRVAGAPPREPASSRRAPPERWTALSAARAAARCPRRRAGRWAQAAARASASIATPIASRRADERAVMLACVTYAARGQDRGGRLAAVPIRGTCGRRWLAARSALASLGPAGGETDPSPPSKGRTPRPGRRRRRAPPGASARSHPTASPACSAARMSPGSPDHLVGPARVRQRDGAGPVPGNRWNEDAESDAGSKRAARHRQPSVVRRPRGPDPSRRALTSVLRLGGSITASGFRKRTNSAAPAAVPRLQP